VRIRLVSVGRDKEFTAAGAREYAERIRRSVPLDLVELPAAEGADAKDREAAKILEKRLPRGELWALDERGTEQTSAELSRRIARLRDSALDLTLCVGGDEGLGEAVAREARFTWSLSRLTLPHRLARVVALEQIYRAFEILRGGPYHK
jgi:23S rRNA (pseudouridine1915-N3)-methyltransferase